MHHIPNVSYVLQECYRCLEPGGIMLLREPITSLGDWRKPRTGLTKRERGIPFALFHQQIIGAGFSVKKRSLCNFPLLPKILRKLGVSTYSNSMATLLDSLLSRLFFWNKVYHRRNNFQKLGPAAIYYILEKK